MEIIKKYMEKMNKSEVLKPSIIILGIFFFVTIISPKISILLPVAIVAILFEYFILKENIIIQKQHVLVMTFLSIVVLSMFIGKKEYSLIAIPPYIIFSIMFIVFTIKQYTKKQVNFLSWCIQAGGVVACIIIVLFGKAYYGEELRYTIILNGERQDPNFTAVLLCLPMLLFLIKLIYSKTIKSRIINTIGFMITLFTIVLTGSRTGMICIAAIIGTTLIIKIIQIKDRISFKSKKVWGIILIGIVIIGIGFTLLPDQITDRIFNYSSTYNYDNSTIIAGSPRLNIWINAMKLVFQRPIIGYGLGMSDYYMPIHTGLITALHNTYIDVWFQFGIAGLIIFLGIIWSYIRDIIKLKSYYLINGIVIVIIAGGFLDLFYGREVWVILSFIMIILNYISLNKSSIEDILGE